MTKQEYNRGVRRLRKKYIEMETHENKNEIEMEFKRLYYADRSFEYANKESILTLLRLNLSLRCIPFYKFGSHIDIGR